MSFECIKVNVKEMMKVMCNVYLVLTLNFVSFQIDLDFFFRPRHTQSFIKRIYLLKVITLVLLSHFRYKMDQQLATYCSNLLQHSLRSCRE
jgi:NADH:ubiquinone oxidoreductase subunit 3 (subunit A)